MEADGCIRVCGAIVEELVNGFGGGLGGSSLLQSQGV